MFTGDRPETSRAMYETGFASQLESLHRTTGWSLIDAAITGVACVCRAISR
jgi:hypothetical protein